MDERDRDRIDRFVLGTASEEERRQVEDRLFAEDEALALLQDREDALFDDYAHGRLGDADRASLERNRLATAAGRERLAFARAAARLTPAAAPARPWLPAWLPVAASVVLAVATAVLAARTRELGLERKADEARFDARLEELRQQVEAERQRATSPADPDAPPALVLRGQADRGEGDTPELALPASGDPVVVAVPVPVGPFVSYQAVLHTVEGGALVWETAGLQRTDRQIRLAIPKDHLGPGDFILTLSGRRVTGPAVELADHYFRVTMDDAS